MGTSSDDHHQPAPGDMDPTERILAALRSITVASVPVRRAEPDAGTATDHSSG